MDNEDVMVKVFYELLNLIFVKKKCITRFCLCAEGAYIACNVSVSETIYFVIIKNIVLLTSNLNKLQSKNDLTFCEY